MRSLPRTAKTLLAGGIAGAASRSTVSPLERVKIMMQVQDLMPDGKGVQGQRYNTIGEGLRGIYAKEGIRGYFVGNGANVVRILPYSATQFFVFDKLKRVYLDSGRTDFDAGEKLVAGSIAGATSVVVSYPLDFVRGRLSVQGAGTKARYTGISNALVRIASEEGFFKLYHGMQPSLVGIMPYVGIQFMTYHTLKPMAMAHYGAKSDKELGVGVNLACGGIAGAAAQTAAYPFDLLRRRFQMSGVSRAWSSAFACVRCMRVHVNSVTATAMGSGCTPLRPLSILQPTLTRATVASPRHNRTPLRACAVVNKQFAGNGKLEGYDSLLGGFRTVIRNEGVRGLYKGLMPNYAKVVPVIAVQFAVYEELKKLFAI